MTINTRYATENDLIAILEIVNHAILHTTSNYNYDVQTIEQQLEWFFQKQQKSFPIIVALHDNEVVGFGTYGTFREKIGYQTTVEHSVYVKDVYIGKGIGKILMQLLIETAKTQNLHTMIGCIDADNKDSIAFHQKFGFTISGTLPQVAFKFDRWLDLVIVQLLLN
jgi:phosphinothricin acetyltransferase